ncbi:LysR family transcriptional regulator [Cupriavidus necator]|uniref:LysR family transcriptional regulator n=1 Tax=Cupriavidus necator TaxID=106590 RepID=UPI0039C4C596
MITIKQLEAFYWSAELESFEAAAAHLHTTQSAISKRIQELETVLETELFDRSRRKAQIAPRAEELRGLAREVLTLTNRIMDMSRVRGGAPARFRLGVTDLTALTWLPALVQRVRASYPDVTVEPVVDTSVTLVEKLRKEELDLIIVPDAFRDIMLETIPLDMVEYSWLCSPSYDVGVDELDLRQLGEFTIIEQSSASGLGQLVSRWLREHNVVLNKIVSSSNLTASASLTFSGVGISYLPRRIFDDAIADNQLMVLHSRPALPRVPYVAAYDKSKANDFLRFIANVATETCDFTRPISAIYQPRRAAI